jgi:hypothetical protein
MYNPIDLFDHQILTPMQFLEYAEDFSHRSLYLYDVYDKEGADLYPDLPISVHHAFSNLVYIYGMIHGARPKKVLIQGISRVRGFKDVVWAASEAIPMPLDKISHRDKEQVLANLRKRLRHSIIVLAKNAGLEPYYPTIEVHDETPVLSPLSSTIS